MLLGCQSLSCQKTKSKNDVAKWNARHLSVSIYILFVHAFFLLSLFPRCSNTKSVTDVRIPPATIRNGKTAFSYPIGTASAMVLKSLFARCIQSEYSFFIMPLSCSLKGLNSTYFRHNSYVRIYQIPNRFRIDSFERRPIGI
jgi:hypothetical protein